MKPADLERYLKNRTGLPFTAPTIRHWEKCGLLGEIPREGDGQQRVYTTENIQRAELVALFKSISISTRNIRAILNDEGNPQAIDEAVKNLHSYKEFIIPYLEKVLSRS